VTKSSGMSSEGNVSLIGMALKHWTRTERAQNAVKP